MQKDKNKLSQITIILFIAVLTALLGEVKMTVFNSPFRFGLGSASFFFLLLFYREAPLIPTAIISGFFITFFRIGLDYFFLDSFGLQTSFLNHSPIIGYYLIFAIVLYFGRARNFLESPFYLGVLGTFADGFANVVELSVRTLISDTYMLTYANLKYVIIIAFLRSFFVVGLFNMLYTKQMNAVYKEQRRRYEQIQMISSGLYVEAFYLKKLLNEIEDVTAKSFELYKKIKGYQEVPSDVSTIALTVAQEVHEVKKDNQRILAGLEKIINQESVLVEMSLEELISLMIRANQKYSLMLKKDIEFRTNIGFDVQIKKIYPFVIILNNLLANSVEAIVNAGLIEVNAEINNDMLEIKVIDNGIGIPPEEEEIIFQPGYTTKFDQNGRPSTGIGLSHVKSMIEKLEGEIIVHTENGTTEFVVVFPIVTLQKGD